MSAPARKVDQYSSELADPMHPMSELQLRAIINDCKRTLSHVSSYEAAPLYNTMGIAAQRLGLFADAYRYAQCAINLDPNNPFLKTNLGVALADIGKYDEAMDVFGELSGTSVPEYLLLANMAECLACLGLTDDAREAFQDAVQVADLADSTQLMLLAEQASLIGADDAALELTARAIAIRTNTPPEDRLPLDIIASAPASLRQAIEEKRGLRAALQRTRDFADLARSDSSNAAPQDAPSNESRDLAAREAMAMFDATKQMRARANQAVLS